MNTNPQRANLILSYNRQAENRNKGGIEDWKIKERGDFLALLKSEQKGLNARLMDMIDLEFPGGSFDALYSLNSLLHLPKTELPIVLQNIKRVLKPNGLFFLGVYGGYDFEGIWEKDSYDPKRYFSFYQLPCLSP